MKKALRAFARYFLPALLYLGLVFLLFQNAIRSSRENTQLSLRYTDVPLTAQQVAYARSYTLAPDTGGEYGMTFWYQLLDVSVSNDFGASNTAVIYADGEMADVYPARFLAGGYPSAIDTNGIAVSEMLAWRLFGGGDVVGSTLDWNGQTYIVRGVFEGRDTLMLVQVDAALLEEAQFTGLELSGTPTFGDPREKALEFAQGLGLGSPTAVVSGGSIAAVLMLMAVLPAAILVLWFLYKVVRHLRRIPYWARQVVVFGVLLALAFAIPWGMAQLPGWMIPNKWSDLDAWSKFLENLRGYFNEWLGLYPALRDVSLKMQLLWQAALLVPALFAVTTTIRVWNARLTAFLRGPEGRQEEALAPQSGVEESEAEDAKEEAQETDDVLDLLADIPNASPEGDERLR